MTKEQTMIDLLQAAAKDFTPAEKMKFRASLQRDLPAVIQKAAERAKQTDKENQTAKQAEKK